eukprot:TRINITY_DN17316_c0_g1_i1.p1 TRINITY_DN17316_c0_g1~~TRINITY_DN17316_c0_g1_i1.p1  ORF type:complete len:1319 (+),score=307.86 TRINITY_DN17316_c0_g1_i1:54-4010(+)
MKCYLVGLWVLLAAAEDEYQCQQQKRIVGGDLMHVTNCRTEDDCTDYCSKVETCIGVVYAGQKRACTLKSYIRKIESAASDVSGCVKLPEGEETVQWQCSDGGLDGGLLFTTKVDEEVVCKMKCAKVEQCHAIVWHAGDGSCSLRTVSATRSPANAALKTCTKFDPATSSTPTVTDARYQCVTGQHYSAGDLIRLIDVPTLEQCKQYCDKIPVCAGITHHRACPSLGPRRPATTKGVGCYTCDIKGALYALEPSADWRRATSCDRPDRDTIASADNTYACTAATVINDTPYITTSIQGGIPACKALCSGIPKCQALTFSEGFCSMYITGLKGALPASMEHTSCVKEHVMDAEDYTCEWNYNFTQPGAGSRQVITTGLEGCASMCDEKCAGFAYNQGEKTCQVYDVMQGVANNIVQHHGSVACTPIPPAVEYGLLVDGWYCHQSMGLDADEASFTITVLAGIDGCRRVCIQHPSCEGLLFVDNKCSIYTSPPVTLWRDVPGSKVCLKALGGELAVPVPTVRNPVTFTTTVDTAVKLSPDIITSWKADIAAEVCRILGVQTCTTDVSVDVVTHRKGKMLEAPSVSIDVPMEYQEVAAHVAGRAVLMASSNVSRHGLGFKCYGGVGFHGTELAKLPDLSLDACKATCAAMPACTVLVFPGCVVLSSGKSLNTSAKTTSCMKSALPVHDDRDQIHDADTYHCVTGQYSGGELVTVHTMDIQACQGLCTLVPSQCSMFKFSNGTCTLCEAHESNPTAAKVPNDGVSCFRTRDGPVLVHVKPLPVVFPKFTCQHATSVRSRTLIKAAATLVGCHDHCVTLSAECSAFVYLENSGTCLLKSKGSVLEYDPDAITCSSVEAKILVSPLKFKYSCEGDWRYTSVVATLKVEGAKACEAACSAAVVECKAFSYDAKTKQCFLAGSVQGERVAGIVSCHRAKELKLGQGSALSTSEFMCRSSTTYLGDTLVRVENVTSKRACLNHCTRSSACAVALFTHSAALCTLKGALAVKVTLASRTTTSCVRKTGEEQRKHKEALHKYRCAVGKHLVGGDLWKVKATSSAQCREFCNKLAAQCKAVTYYNGWCALKGSEGSVAVVDSAAMSCRSEGTQAAPQRIDVHEAYDCHSNVENVAPSLIVVEKIVSVQKCVALCEKVSECRLVTHSQGTCRLSAVHVASMRTIVPGAVGCVAKAQHNTEEHLGVKDSLSYVCGTDKIAADVLYEWSSIKTLDMCQQKCIAVNACAGIRYVGATCTLLHGVLQQYTLNNAETVCLRDSILNSQTPAPLQESRAAGNFAFLIVLATVCLIFTVAHKSAFRNTRRPSLLAVHK